MNLIFKRSIYIFIFSLTIFSGCKSEKNEGPKEMAEPEIMVIPKPKSVNMLEGNFQFSENTVFVVNNDRQKEIAKLLIDKFNSVAGWDLKTVNKSPDKNYILFKENKELPGEGYILYVSDEKISIEASTGSGFIYALETIRQLLPPEIESKEKITNVSWSIPNLEIEDEPRFEWRGLMLDVARHFFEKEYILNTIDRLAMLKMNTLQLHLVDDQGWRIEIKKYPK
ncbi:MAG TPA: family 20 glycosylhydrolase, partial [Salinimicrobium sp.]|nr:family 20 glycosylhydrolase [Salinimicrobium sp.]